MAKFAGDSLEIMKKVIGANDGSDPEASTAVLLGYITDFFNLIMPQDVKLFDNWKFMQFDTIAGQGDYPLEAAPLPLDMFVNFVPPVFVDNQEIDYFQNVGTFFNRWNIDDNDQPEGRPTEILFHDRTLFLRSIPDKEYTVRLLGYIQGPELTAENIELPDDYVWRYVAYGAAIDWLGDHGRFEQIQNVFPIFDRYRDLVLSRTAIQTMTQRPRPAL